MTARFIGFGGAVAGAAVVVVKDEAVGELDEAVGELDEAAALDEVAAVADEDALFLEILTDANLTVATDRLCSAFSLIFVVREGIIELQ